MNSKLADTTRSSCKAGCCTYVTYDMPATVAADRLDTNTQGFICHEKHMRDEWDRNPESRFDAAKEKAYAAYFRTRAHLFEQPDSAAFNGVYYLANQVPGNVAFPWAVASVNEVKYELYGRDPAGVSTLIAQRWLKLWETIRVCTETILCHNMTLHSRSPTMLYYNKLPPLTIASSETAERISNRGYTPYWLKDIVNSCDCCGVPANRLFTPQECENVCRLAAAAYVDQLRGGMRSAQAVKLIVPHHYCEACAAQFMDYRGVDANAGCMCCDAGTPHKDGSLRYCREKGWIGDLTQELADKRSGGIRKFYTGAPYEGAVGSVPRPKPALPPIVEHSDDSAIANDIMFGNMSKDRWLIETQCEIAAGSRGPIDHWGVAARPGSSDDSDSASDRVDEMKEMEDIDKLLEGFYTPMEITPGQAYGGAYSDEPEPKKRCRRCHACDRK